MNQFIFWLISICVTLSFLQGYSFVAPSILFNKNAVMGDFLDAPVSVDRPGSATVRRSAMLKVQQNGTSLTHYVLYTPAQERKTHLPYETVLL